MTSTEFVDSLLSNRSEFDYSADVATRKARAKRGGRREGAGRKAILANPARLTFDLEKADSDALAALAERRGVSVAQLLRDAVRALLRRQR